MTITYKKFLFLSLCLLTPAGLHAQAEKETKKEQPVRTLRVMIAGARAMPAFETRGDKIVEVEPPVSKMPPTSFAFVNPDHRPKAKPGETASATYSAWPFELVRIQNYKGPAELPLLLRRPLVEQAGADQEITCELGEALNPLILLHAAGSKGWGDAKATVVDMSPEKMPAHSALIINFSPLPIKAYFADESGVVAANNAKVLRLQVDKTNNVRYRIDTVLGGKPLTVSNSSYHLSENSRLIVVALPSPAKIANNPLSLHLIADPL